MVCAAIRDHDGFRADDMELRRGGVSYSYDTVTELGRRHPEHSYAYIIGSDRVNDLHQWHAIEQLASLVFFIGLERPLGEGGACIAAAILAREGDIRADARDRRIVYSG